MSDAPLFLVACTKAKARRACRARDLYAASDWFAKARAYVEGRLAAEGGTWRILSARHGLVKPARILAPYQASLIDMGRRDRAAWAIGVRRQLLAAGLAGRPTVILAGALYRAGLEDWLADHGSAIEVPLRGLALGEQKAWLAAAARA